ncbi:MAG TPA: hypothetical protein VIV11_23690 [Kofleriaceae bacterium]
MGRLSVLLLLIVAGCGGTQIPQHNGYKGKKPQPWKKAKALKFDDKLEAKAEGELAYGEYKRAVWYAADLSSPGQLELRLEITPPGDSVNDEFDLGFEVLDPGFRVIMRSDSQEGDDAGELNKLKTLKDLEPGKYLIHLYLQHRLDSADYVLRAAFKPMSSVGQSDFPAQVAFTPTLPMVPLQDDTPKTYKPPTTTVTVRKPKGPKEPRPEPKPKDPPPATSLSARIIGMQVVGGGTQITVGRGTSGGAIVGMKGKIVGVPSGSFTLATCNERTCTATVPATPDQIKGSGSVVLTP